MIEKAIQNLSLIREHNPLIHNITNDVTMDFIANGLLAIGASPVMSHATEELEEMIGLASAIVINIGTLDHKDVETYSKAATIANKLDKPIVLDPVGAGATSYRTHVASQLLSTHKISIVRGNASEILALSGNLSSTKGVDSTAGTHQALQGGNQLAHQNNVCVVINGKEDAVITKNCQYIFDYGHAIMPRVVGMGCVLTSVLAAFHAIDDNTLTAAASGIILYGMAGEIAAEKPKVEGPASFKTAFLDALYSLSEEEIMKRYRDKPTVENIVRTVPYIPLHARSKTF